MNDFTLSCRAAGADFFCYQAGGGGDKNGTLLPNIGHHNGARASNSYPSVASKTNYGSHLGESLSRSPSAGLSGRVDWKSKYLK